MPGVHAHDHCLVLLAERPLPTTEVTMASGPSTSLAPGPASVLVWPPNLQGQLHCEGEFRCFSLRLSGERLSGTANVLFGGKDISWKPVAWATDPFVLASARRLAELEQGRHAGREVVARRIAEAVTSHVLLEYAVPLERGGQTAIAPKTLAAIVWFIRENLGETLTVERLANLAMLSPGYFSENFTRATGRSPHAYVTEMRIEAAKELLAVPQISLAEVAVRCGFSSQSHLTRVFGRDVGVTPGAYRRRIIANGIE